MRMTKSFLYGLVSSFVLFIGSRDAFAHRSPEGCGGAGVGVQVFKFRLNGAIANTITNGERVIYTIQIQNDAQLPTPGGIVPVCDVTCASVLFQCPDSSGNPGAAVQVATNVNLPFGTTPFVVGSVTCTVSVASGVVSARARAEVVGIVHDVSIADCMPNATCQTNACDPDTGGGAQEVSVTVRNPCVSVTKQCVSATNFNGSAVLVNFTGTITNCGDETLANIMVVNNQPAAGTLVTNIPSLAPGAGTTFAGSYTNFTTLCGPFPDTITVSATGVESFGTARATNSAQCTIIYNPGIRVTKTCPPPVQPGGVISFTGSVSNSGNVVLTNIFVFNDQPAPNTVLIGPITLGLGQSTNFSGNYSVPADSCGPYTDTLTAIGTSICGASVTNSDTKLCPGTNSPGIVVFKSCPANPVPPGGLMVISGVVSNTGNITLTNVTVTNVIAAIAQSHQVVASTNLPPGGSIAFTDSYVVPLDSCGPYRDTVVARGADKCFGRIVTASDFKDCPGITTPRIAVFKFCPTNLVAPGGIAVFSGIVSNAGNITLTNVTVVNNRPTNNTPVFGPITLAPGESTNFIGSEVVPANCCAYFDTLTAAGASICTGSNVVATATATCPTITTPLIVVTKNCPLNPVPLGQPLVFSGIVSNAGNITLIDVTVVDNRPTNNTPVLGPLTLAPGEWANFFGNYTVPINTCDTSISDTVTARGTDVCTGSNVISTATAGCPIIPTPRLSLTKNCPPNPVAPGELLVFTGTVSNSGTVTLTNVFVVNDRPAPNTPVAGPFQLTPGQSIGFNGSYLAPYDCCGPCVDTLTATGKEFCTGSNVVATASAACPRVTTPQIAVSRQCPPGTVTAGDLVFFTGTVTNAGNATLNNVLVVDDQAGVLLSNLALAPGEAIPYFGSYIPTNCGPSTPSGVTASANDVCTGVVVSNRFVTTCSVTCSTNQAQPVLIFNQRMEGGLFLFSFNTETNGTYKVQFSDSLLPTYWQTMSNLVGSGSTATIPDTPTNAQRFYRVLLEQ